jgi:protein SCO1
MNDTLLPLSRRSVLALSTAAVLLPGCTPAKPAFQGTDITGADFARDFSLSDHNGVLRSLKDFSGQVVLMFFGYTQCPDVCPTSLAELADVKKRLGADGSRLQGIFVTVDPERDTPELLKAYMANFDPGFLALRPSPDALVLLAKEFKLYYKRVDGKTPTSYTMDHTANSMAYDPKGRLRLYLKYGMGAEGITHDVKLLLSGQL